MGNRNSLELWLDENYGDLLGLQLTPGSGNIRGDADMQPKFKDIHAVIEFAAECKQRTTQINHNIPWKDWQKARRQTEGKVLLFLTENSEHHKMFHIEHSDFMEIMLVLLELMKDK